MADNAQKWEGHPWRARFVRWAAWLLPLLFGLGVAFVLSRIIPLPQTIPGVIAWWVGITIVATLAVRIADRVAKKLMPLAVLMNLSLVFPDEAPKRFGVAMRSGTTRNLEELLADAEAAGREDDLTHAAETILALGAALNAHDPRTRGHVERVRAYADMLGEEMGYNAEDRNKLKWAAMLHDIGKLRVPSEIINKPGKLDDSEWAVMRRHPEWGMELSAPLHEWLGEFANAVGQHHEKFDGSGYPNGIKGEEISMAARITAVADAYDVMTSVRSYKDARPASEAREELARSAGSHFDPEVVRNFLNIAIGRQRRIAGPLSWLSAQVPLVQGGVQTLTTLATHAATATQTAIATATIAGTAVVAPAIINTPDQAIAEEPIRIEARDDSVSLDEDTDVLAAILGNDDGEIDRDSLAVVVAPEHGTAEVTINKRISYTPGPDFSGTDALTYRVCDFDGRCRLAVLNIEVKSVNDPPFFSPAPSAATDEDTPVTFSPLDVVGDIDSDVDPASLTVVGTALYGVALVNGDGTVTYTPPADYSGPDSFVVQVCDVAGACGTTEVFVAVAPVNDAPTATSVVEATDEDTAVVVTPVGADPEGDALSPVVTSPPTNGTVAVNPDGTLTYTPAADFWGTDGFAFNLCDPDGACAAASAVVTVAAVNDPPVVPGPGPLTTPEDTVVSFDPLVGASDPDGDSLSVSAFDAVSANGGTITEGSLIYTPAPDFFGVDSFSYTVADAGGETVTVPVTITVTPVNDPPVGTLPPQTGMEDVALLITVVASFSDPDGDILAIDAFDAVTAAGGTVTDNGDGTVTYLGPSGYFGADSFSITVGDGNGGTITQTVSLTLVEFNNAPVLGDDSVVTKEEVSVLVAPLANDSDPDGDPLLPASVAIVTPPANGTSTPNGSGGIDYVPDPDFHGTDTFTYTVSDGDLTGTPATVTITVTAINDAPSFVIGPDQLVAEDDGPISNLGWATAIKPGPPAESAQTVSFIVTNDDPALFSAQPAVAPDGTLTFESAPNQHGAALVRVKLQDSGGTADGGVDTSPTVTFTIKVAPVPDDPVANDDGAITQPGVPVVVNVTANDGDVDGDSLTVALGNPPAFGGFVLVGNQIQYTPIAAFSGLDAFTYEIDDGTGRTDTATVTINVASGSLVSGLFLQPGSGFGDYLLDPVVPPAANPVPDYEGDGNDGFTIKRSGGNPAEGNPAKYRNYDRVHSSITEYRGPATINLLTTAKDFSLDGGGDYKARKVQPYVYLQDCAADGTGCVTVLSYIGPEDPDWNDGVASWTYKTIPLGLLDHTVDAGRMLRLKVMFGDNDTWIAMTSAFAPSVGSLELTESDRPPVAIDDTFTIDEDTNTIFDVLANDYDATLDPATLSIVTPPGHGAAFVTGSYEIDYTPGADEFVPDTFEYEVCDASLECSTANVEVTINPLNDKPTFSLISPPDQTVAEDSPEVDIVGFAFDMVAEPNDPAQDTDFFTLTPTILDGDLAFKKLVLNDADGKLEFEPADDTFGTAEIAVTLTDKGPTGPGHFNTSDPQTFLIIVTNVNDDVDFDLASGKIEVLEDAGAVGPISQLINITPGKDGAGNEWTVLVPPDVITITLVEAPLADQPGDYNPAMFSVPPFVSYTNGDPTASVSFTTALNGYGSVLYDVTIDDGEFGLTDRFEIEIDEVNDDPVAVGDSDSTPMDTPLVMDAADWMLNDYDDDFDPISIDSVDGVSVAGGTVVPAGGGLYTYTPPLGYTGPDSFTYTIKDGRGGLGVGTISLTVS